jgi:peptidoglycan/LPS O-acetylase OafA/YrhL
LLTSKPDNFKRHIPALDGVRGFAAASVFLLHYGGGAQSSFLPLRFVGEVLHLGWAGVSLFFVLSGFLITGILWDGFQREHWWRNFYIRRSLRIFPLYYLALIIALLIALTVDFGSNNLSSFFIYAFYLQNIPALTVHLRQFQHVWLDHFWSLAVEEQFYLIWPFLLFALRAKGRRHALGLCASGWTLSLLFRVIVIAFHRETTWATTFLAGRAGELCAGAFLAILVRGNPAQLQRTLRKVPLVLGAAAVAIGAILWKGSLPSDPWMATLGISAFSILFAGIVAGCLYPSPIQSFFSNPFLRWLGKISYGIYVYHLLFRAQFQWITRHIAPHASRDASLAVTAAVAMVGTISIASLSFYTYEKFFLGLKEKFSSAKPVTVEA